MKYAKTDPRVSCPIVCGENMRATGFFYTSENEEYLVTARNNVLPTTLEARNPDGSKVTIGSTDFTLPTIDIYFRSDDGLDQYRVDIRDTDVRQTPDIDIIGIPFDFDVESYGYHVWKQIELEDPLDSTETFSIMGFDWSTFPSSDEYDIEEYSQSISQPRKLNIENLVQDVDSSLINLISYGWDKEYDGQYKGISGAPVLGDGLVGVHLLDTGFGGNSDYSGRRIGFIRAPILQKLLS